MKDQVNAGFIAGIKAAMPEAVLAAHLPKITPHPTAILALGKAAGPMAAACRNAGLDAPGIIITHDETVNVPGFKIFIGGHPVPDEGSVKAADAAISFCNDLTEDDHLLVLVSGGGSALMTKPAPGLTLDDKMTINQALLKSGMDIHQINIIRRLASGVKGGRLARYAAPASITQLVMSDVPATGDMALDMAAIASGPFAPDAFDIDHANALINKAGLDEHEALSAYLNAVDNTPSLRPVGADDDAFMKTKTAIIASNAMVRKAVEAAMGGVNVTLPDLDGEAAEMGARLAEMVMDADGPITGVSGGETVVTFSTDMASGLGGRSQELALAFLVAMSGYVARGHDIPRFVLLAGGTDGRDGPTDAAGALVTDLMIAQGDALDIMRDALQRHDSYYALDQVSALIKMPPTGTNLGDVVILKTDL